MKAIGYFLDVIVATGEDHKEYVRWFITKFGSSCFFYNLEGQFKSDCTQFWDAVVDAKHRHHEELLLGVKASRERLMNEAESWKKEVTQGTFTTKKRKTLPDDAIASKLEAESVNAVQVDYGLVARTALQNVQQKLATKEFEQWVRSDLENTELHKKLDMLEKTSQGRTFK